MNVNPENQKWGVAFVIKSPLPPQNTWTEVPFYTYLIEEGRTKIYRAMQKDCPIDIDAVKSYPVIDFSFATVPIKFDESVFIDWEGNYFIGKEDSYELPVDRNYIYRGKDLPNFNPTKYRRKQNAINYEYNEAI